MSVLNQSDEEQVECPLCMEPLEVDDLNFYPCTCGYQICRFCWHRIRTDENGLCPHCRKMYSEDPADFVPLSQEQVVKLKAEKRQRDQQRKAKLSENRKHLASVRVVQRNLVFVVGLPMRLADSEVLKRHEYFGKFGKIHKVVINQSTAYAGTQGPSASAYVTYLKSDDALRAIQSVNNIMIDGRLIKSSLGTTKYCSHFMKSLPCPKPDCMYLHDLGDSEASFTKEQMHAGKHQEFEKKLHEALLVRSNVNASQTTNIQNGIGNIDQKTILNTVENHNKSKEVSTNGNCSNINNEITPQITTATNKENWPQLNNTSISIDINDNKTKTKPKQAKKNKPINSSSTNTSTASNSLSSSLSDVISITNTKTSTNITFETTSTSNTTINTITNTNNTVSNQENNTFSSHNKLVTKDDDSASTSSKCSTTGSTCSSTSNNNQNQQLITDTLPDIISSTEEDWAAAFGFRKDEKQQSQPKILPPHLISNPLVQQSSDIFGFPTKIDDTPQQQRNHLYYKDDIKEDNSNIRILPQQFFADFQKNHNEIASKEQYSKQMSRFFADLQIQKSSDIDHLLFLQHQQQRQQFNSQLLNNYKNGDLGVYQNNSQLTPMQFSTNLSPSSIFQQEYNNNKHLMNQSTSSSHISSSSSSSIQQQQNKEDELDFDPFQETQKALAELIASEQTHKAIKPSTNGRALHSSIIPPTSINAIQQQPQPQQRKIHNLPPPPPGFLPPPNTNNNNTNSIFSSGSVGGSSKIFPFLNLSNIQQTQQNIGPNWGTNCFNTQQHQQNNVNHSTNDWKDFDSAILSTRRHVPDCYNNLLRPQQQNEFVTTINCNSNNNYLSTSSSPSSSLQNNGDYNGYTTQTTRLFRGSPNWFNNNDFAATGLTTNTMTSTTNFGATSTTQLSSPPGFSSNQTTTKQQQEC